MTSSQAQQVDFVAGRYWTAGHVGSAECGAESTAITPTNAG